MMDKGGPRYNIGIDVGGTNTDGVLYDCIEKKITASVKISNDDAPAHQSAEIFGNFLGIFFQHVLHLLWGI